MSPDSPLEKIFKIQDQTKIALKKLGIFTVLDLLYHFPVRYGDTEEIKLIGSLTVGDNATVYGKITKLETKKAYIQKIPMATAELLDETGKVKLVWFNQAYIAKMIKENSLVRVEGKVAERKGEIYFSNPKIEMIKELPIGVGKSIFADKTEDDHSLYPIYPESKGVTSDWFYQKILRIFQSKVLDQIEENIPNELLEKYHLPTIKTALFWIHTPKERNNATSARKRFAFEEIFFIQLRKQQEKVKWQKEKSFEIEVSDKKIKEFIKDFPFTPTNAQLKVIKTISDDFKKGFPMARLLEGDVGSGKTAVASTASFITVSSSPNDNKNQNLQVAYMAPTEILATQLFENFIKFFKSHKVPIALLTSSGARKFPAKQKDKNGNEQWTKISKNQLKKWVKEGIIPILIGTHSLIQKTVEFKNLALVIIDEQHRFGTGQRQRLANKGNLTPHLLSMTATPIPRTLSLTIFGDLDLSLLDELPKGRKPVITEIVLPNEREKVYKKIKEKLKEGRQLYVICPRIDEADPNNQNALLAKSVVEEAKRLKKEIFKEFNIGILHGNMTASEKEKTMIDFLEKKIDILVATSVVEVGVNVVNATMIIIEGAERFGLSQLHQLRGRVMRSEYEPLCFIFSESKSSKSIERLKALKLSKNGFELAEFDLKQRGAGELYGGKQWGLSDLGMDALQNIKMVELAREEAKKMIISDPDLKKHSLLKEELEKRSQQIHFE